MESFKNYRDNLAKKLTDIRSIGDHGKEAAKVILQGEQSTETYQQAKELKTDIRDIEKAPTAIDQQIAELAAHIASLKAQKESIVQELGEKQMEYGVETKSSMEQSEQVDWNERIAIIKSLKMAPNTELHNPETQKLNYETLGEPTILFKPEWVGKQRGEVFSEIIAEYGNDYYIPGIEYQAYLAENPDNIPQQLKDDNWYITPGSLRGDSGGSVNVPSSSWDGSSWYRDERYVEFTWGSSDRVVLFPKSLETLNHE